MSELLYIAPGEALRLSRYLIGEDCPEATVQHYTAAVQKLFAILTPDQQKVWDRMLKSHIYMKLIDAGLAVTYPQSPLRKRIFIMLTLLESRPEFTQYFLPQKRSIWYLIPLGFRAGLSAVYLVTGSIFTRISGISRI
ncbi:MAG: hypothetical protein JSS76_03035 [Bacteroidetes bacterium]|nr:hypothetical protein [Bacteroidota bacterium]MBS1683699.1 hypothetical protein [Bacteroidota bacterium]